MMEREKGEREKEREPSDKDIIKGEQEDVRNWICPRCGTRYWGWSTMNTCSKCGYKD